MDLQGKSFTKIIVQLPFIVKTNDLNWLCVDDPCGKKRRRPIFVKFFDGETIYRGNW